MLSGSDIPSHAGMKVCEHATAVFKKRKILLKRLDLDTWYWGQVRHSPSIVYEGLGKKNDHKMAGTSGLGLSSINQCEGFCRGARGGIGPIVAVLTAKIMMVYKKSKGVVQRPEKLDRFSDSGYNSSEADVKRAQVAGCSDADELSTFRWLLSPWTWA